MPAIPITNLISQRGPNGLFDSGERFGRKPTLLATLIWMGSTLSAFCLEPPPRAPRSDAREGYVAHRISMRRLPWIVLSLVSNTVMLAGEFIGYRNRRLRVCSPLSAAVKVYVSGSPATFAEPPNTTVTR